MPRFWEIDFLRGTAIIMMVAFHFMWDLKYFEFITFNIYSGFWGLFQLATASLFLFLVGVSLSLSYSNNKNNYLRRFFKRGLMVFGGGLLITIFTLIAFPEKFIYFGILHLIGVSIILSIPLVKKKIVNLVLAIALILIPLLFNIPYLQIDLLVWTGFAQPLPALDFFPVIPWFGVVLLGIFAGNTLYENGTSKIEFRKPEIKGIGFVELLGQNSLLIYFIHQPVLFTLVYIASMLI